MEKNNTVILARVSSKAQEDEGYSLDAQLKLLYNYCDTKGLVVVKVFKIAETASKDQSRKIFHEMLAYIAKPRNKVYHLTVEKTDRFTRNFRDAVAIDEWLEKDGDRRLHAVKESLLLHKDAKSDVKFMWNIHVSVAKKYADNLREESMKGWAEKLAQGWIPAPAPPGYKTVVVHGKRVHEPDDEVVPLIQRAFKLYLDPSQSIASIAKEMRIMGIKTKKGRYYHKSQVQHILTNPYYVGVIRFDGKEYPGAQTPIIDIDLFERVQGKLHKGRPIVMKRHNPTLKNLLTCKDCGGAVTWQLQKGHYYGSCQRRSPNCRGRKLLRQDYVEQRIMGMLKALVCPAPEIIEWTAATMQEEHAQDSAGKEKLLNAINVQIERIKKMDESLYDDKLAGEISAEKYKQKHQQFVAQQEELERKRDGFDMTQGRKLDHRLTILELTQKAAEIYPTLSPEPKRLIITTLFKNLTYQGEEVVIEYSDFARLIADNVQQTYQVLGGRNE